MSDKQSTDTSKTTEQMENLTVSEPISVSNPAVAHLKDDLKTPYNTPTAANYLLRPFDSAESGAPSEEMDSPKTAFANNLSTKLSAVASTTEAALRDLASQFDELETQRKAELAAIKAKYDQLAVPLHDRRKDVAKDIEGFWLTVLQNCVYTRDDINERDAEALRFLSDISTVALTGEEHGFKLVFTFAENNGFFSNAQLTKTYLLDGDDEDEASLIKVTGCEIAWLAGKNLTVRKVQVQAKGKNRGKGRGGAGGVKVVEEECDSFFRFFMPPQIPSEEEAEELGEEELEEIDNALEMDLQMGVAIKQRVVPLAVKYYLGEVEDEDDDEGMFGGMDDEAEEGEEEEDEEEEEEQPKRVGKTGGAGKGGKGAPPDCKQQ
jgi:nucleosome assembly protein 1-like 1